MYYIEKNIKDIFIVIKRLINRKNKKLMSITKFTKIFKNTLLASLMIFALKVKKDKKKVKKKR